MLTVSRARADQVARLVVGSLLLLPALCAFGLAFWLPALRTLSLSLQEVYLWRPGQLAGLDSYVRLWQDPVLGAALGRSLLAALVRLAAVTALPALVAWAWGGPLAGRRLGARLALGVGMALSAPAGLGILWRLAAEGTPWLRRLALEGGAHTLRSMLLLEFAAALGLGGGLMATALLLARPGRARWRILALGGVLALYSGLDTFSLPFAAAGGGPHERTVSLSLHLFRTAFVGLRLGEAAAGASLLLAASVGLGLVFALLSERWHLRLEPAAREQVPGHRSRMALLVGTAALVALLAPLVWLYLWAAGRAFLFPGRPVERAAGVLEVGLALVNGNLAPLLAILLFQLPASYLAALSLTLARPFGARGSRLASVALLASGFVPPVAVGVGLVDPVRAAGLLNTPPAAGLPLVAGAASLYLFKLYFAGRAPLLERALAAGQPLAAALWRLVVRPSAGVATLAGALSFLLAGQSLAWPLLVLATKDYYPLSLRLVVLQSQLAGDPAALAAGAWLVLTCWGVGMLLVWWPLQALVLERVEVAAEVEPQASPSALPEARYRPHSSRGPSGTNRAPTV